MMGDGTRTLAKALCVGLLACLAVCAGCRPERVKGNAQAPKPPQKKMVGMTVGQLAAHIQKHYGMTDYAAASVMGESAYEVYINPKDKAAPVLIVAWTADDEGVPIVDQVVFTAERVPELTDEDAVVTFCEKAFRAKSK